MAPTPLPRAPVRPAAEVNEQIRMLWMRTGGRLSAQQREEYARLVVEWAAAVRAQEALDEGDGHAA